MHVVSLNVLLQMIKSKCKIWKILIVFVDDFRWIKRCIFEIAHVSHWTIFEVFSWITLIFSIFLSWLIIFDRQYSKRKCQFQKIVFIKMFLRNWIALTNFSIDRYFKKNKLMFFFNIANYCVDWFFHQCFFIHVSYKVLLFKTSYEHQNNINKWHINDVIEKHSSIFFVNTINDEHDFIFFDQHKIVWCIDHFVRRRYLFTN
jgi:hypothetical protein